MSKPHLLFCPYLHFSGLDGPISFADWELGPQESFEDRWGIRNSRTKPQPS